MKEILKKYGFVKLGDEFWLLHIGGNKYFIVSEKSNGDFNFKDDKVVDEEHLKKIYFSFTKGKELIIKQK